MNDEINKDGMIEKPLKWEVSPIQVIRSIRRLYSWIWKTKDLPYVYDLCLCLGVLRKRLEERGIEIPDDIYPDEGQK